MLSLLPQPQPKLAPYRDPKDKDVSYGSNRWYKECGGKLAYSTTTEAAAVIEELLRKPLIHDEKGARLSIYACRWCDWYHVGHVRIDTGNWKETVYVSLNHAAVAHSEHRLLSRRTSWVAPRSAAPSLRPWRVRNRNPL